MDERALIRGFCKFCGNHPKFKKVQRMIGFGTKEDAYFNIQIVLLSILKEYHASIANTMGFGEYLNTRVMMERKIPEFTQNILDSFKNI